MEGGWRDIISGNYCNVLYNCKLIIAHFNYIISRPFKKNNALLRKNCCLFAKIVFVDNYRKRRRKEGV